MALILYETPAGFSLFKVTDERGVAELSDTTPAERVREVLQLVKFEPFADTVQGLEAVTQSLELNEPLRAFLERNVPAGAELMCGEAAVARAVTKSELFKIQANVVGSADDLMRCVRSNLEHLIEDLSAEDTRAMSLGLAHSLSRFKLKFDPNKIDTMIVQAVALLDDLDKEINWYAMRAREWYGMHFPELSKIVSDNLAYAKCVHLMGQRDNAPSTDFSHLLTEDAEHALKEAQKISMGSEVADDDVRNVRALCKQVIDMSAYRERLWDYLQARMRAIAPNLTALVGELVGARLIAKAGSLVTLAKYPASTVQILGAEKALFRALKAKADTPKYGLIYHAALVGQTSTQHKGKIARMLGAKCAKASRVDAFGDARAEAEARDAGDSSSASGDDGDADADPDAARRMGLADRAAVEKRMRELEARGAARQMRGAARAPAPHAKYSRATAPDGAPRTAPAYDTGGDSTLATKKDKKKEKKDKKDKKKRKRESVERGDGGSGGDATAAATAAAAGDEDVPAKKQKKEKKDKDKKKKKKKDTVHCD